MTNQKPTRAEMADALDIAQREAHPLWHLKDMCVAAAAELRKSCASCDHMRHPEPGVAYCVEAKDIDGQTAFNRVPTDGTGYCSHGWEPKAGV